MVTGVIQITGPLFLVFMFILERYIQTLKKILILFMISGITPLEISRKEPLFINAIYISRRSLIQPRCLQERSSREQRKSIFRGESITTIILSYFLFLTRAGKQQTKDLKTHLKSPLKLPSTLKSTRGKRNLK